MHVLSSFLTRHIDSLSLALRKYYCGYHSGLHEFFSILLAASAATLFLRKSSTFHDKKHQIHKKTLDYKSKLTHSEHAQKRRCNGNHRPCATYCKLETKNTGDSSNACGCLHRSLKLLTDDQVTSQLFNSKHIMLCVI